MQFRRINNPGNSNGNGNGNNGSNSSSGSATYDFVNTGLSASEAELKKKYEKRKILGFWQQIKYLMFKTNLRWIILAVLAIALALFFGSVILAWSCDFYLAVLVFLLWPVLLGYGATKLKYKIGNVPQYNKAVPIIWGKRVPDVVLDEGWTIFQFGSILGHTNVNTLPVDVNFPVKDVKTAGGGYCKEVVLSFTLKYIEEAINEFLTNGGKPDEKRGAGGIIDRFDNNLAAAVRYVFDKIPLDEAQAMEESTLQQILALALTGLFSSSNPEDIDMTYEPKDINPHALIPLYYLGVKLANINIDNVQPIDSIVAAQTKVILEGYESIYERQDTNTKLYQMLAIVRELRNLGVKTEAIPALSILTMVWDTEDIKNGARNLIGTKALALLGSALGKDVSGIGEMDLNEVLKNFTDMNQQEIQEAMKRMEEMLSEMGYAKKKGGKK